MRMKFALATATLMAVGACSNSLSLPEKPERPQGNLPEFTQNEKNDIYRTIDFFDCTLGLSGGVMPPDFVLTSLFEICAEATGFSEETFSNIVDQMQNRYGDAWMYMLEDLLQEQNTIPAPD